MLAKIESIATLLVVFFSLLYFTNLRGYATDEGLTDTASSEDSTKILTASQNEEYATNMLQEILSINKNNKLQQALALVTKEYSSQELMIAREILQQYISEIEATGTATRAIEDLYLARYLFPSELQDMLPQRIFFEDYIIQMTHKDEMIDGKMTASYWISLITKESLQQTIDVSLPKDVSIASLWSNNYAYKLNGKLYPPSDVREFASEPSHEKSMPNLITGYQVNSPPTPNFNQRSRNIAVILPYTAEYPLPANYRQYLDQRLANVRDYFLANSENTAAFTFSYYPLQVSSRELPEREIIALADPLINYANYDFVTIFNLVIGEYGSGYGVVLMTNPRTPYYLRTNDGPLAGAIAVVWLGINISPPRLAEHIIEHEIGHILSFWNPQFNAEYFAGIVPHADGVLDRPTKSRGNQVYHLSEMYGDGLDVMGRGLGLFGQHSSVYLAGLRSPSTVRTVRESGTYSLCDIQHMPQPNTNCPQELLITNPNGINLAIELRTPSGPDAYYVNNGCSNSLFDGIIVRAVDIEEGGPLGNTLFGPSRITGNVILPQRYTSTFCPANFPVPNMRDYPVQVGQQMQTPLGDITLLSLNTLPNGGKQAMVQITYRIPQCSPNQFSFSSYPPHSLSLYTTNFWPVDIPYKINIFNDNHCLLSDLFVTQTGVLIGSTIHRASVSTTLPFLFYVTCPPCDSSIFVPAPRSLMGTTGVYPLTLTVTQQSTQQSFSATSALNLQSYTPQIFGPFRVSSCFDTDPVPFTPQNLGANFDSPYPQIAGFTLNPPLPGIPSEVRVYDTCINSLSDQPLKATDIVCGSNTGIPGFSQYAFLIVEDCRFVKNDLVARCFLGQCRTPSFPP